MSFTILLGLSAGLIAWQGCEVKNAPSATEQSLARTACLQASARMEELFGVAPANARIEFVQGERLRITVWKDSGILHLPRDSTASGYEVQSLVPEAGYWTALVPHELAHALNAARSGTLHEYGADRNDWFMEAVAIWAESPDARGRRLEQAAEFIDVLPLERLVRMMHPNFTDDSPRPVFEEIRTNVCPAPCPYREGPDTLITRHWRDSAHVMHVDTLVPSDPILRRSDERRAYYPMAFAFLSFLHSRIGAAGMSGLELELNRSGPDALLRVPGLPRTWAALEREFHEWISASSILPASPR